MGRISIKNAGQHQPELLQSIARTDTRQYLDANMHFHGFDLWHAYDLSWLDAKGLPQVAVGRLKISAESTHLPESKSLKLYLNSFAQYRSSWENLKATLASDLSACLGRAPTIDLVTLEDFGAAFTAGAGLPGFCLDRLPVDIDSYDYDAKFLRLDDTGQVKNASLHSHLLRTLCPLTGQPDWASLYIAYSGPAICHIGLLRYLVSYRFYAGFHEHVVERIFYDISSRCQPDELEVYACFQRRGGLDINPYRSFSLKDFSSMRTSRQ